MPKIARTFLAASAAFCLAACASTPYGGGNQRAAAAPAANATAASAAPQRLLPRCETPDNSFACDRRAILAMQGEYAVSFHFDETVPLAPGYEPRPDKDSGGHELVVLVEDSGTRIVLQHILVGKSGVVIKHWRQDWQFETAAHWTYVGDQRFERRERAPDEVRGTWTQFVYEVHDGPRYAGIGRWNHRYGVATWTSERTWRPLPRREYTTRDDYQLLNVENRHTITPTGWTHEQDNTKVMRRDGRDAVLVREFGFNDYRLVTGHDFGPGQRYWEETAPFWEAVRTRWDAALTAPALRLNYPVNEEGFLTAVLERAKAFRKDRDLVAATAWIDATFAERVAVDPPRLASGGATTR
jgi:hypothetical protein